MELPSESIGICREAMVLNEQLPSFATDVKAQEVLYGVAKKRNANLRNKPMNINHTTIEKNDSTLSVTNHQAVATGYIGAGNSGLVARRRRVRNVWPKL